MLKQPISKIEINVDEEEKMVYIDLSDISGHSSGLEEGYSCLAIAKTRITALKYARKRLIRLIKNVEKLITKETGETFK